MHAFHDSVLPMPNLPPEVKCTCLGLVEEEQVVVRHHIPTWPVLSQNARSRQTSPSAIPCMAVKGHIVVVLISYIL